MFRYIISSSLVLLVACGGTSTEMTMDVPESVPDPIIEEETPPIPVTFAAGAFEDGFSDINFAARQSWANEALGIVDTLEASDLETLGTAGSATYSGLIQLDYNGYVDEFGGNAETYLVASALGKMTLAIAFSEFNNNEYVSFDGKADSFIRDDNTPLEGEYDLSWGPGLITTDDFKSHTEDFVIYMDGSLSAGDTQYSGDANMYLDAFGEDGSYLSGRVGGELQIWSRETPLEGTIYGNT